MERLESITDHISSIESYDYDEIGNVTQLTDRRGSITTYEYDRLNRLTEVERLTNFRRESAVTIFGGLAVTSRKAGLKNWTNLHQAWSNSTRLHNDTRQTRSYSNNQGSRYVSD